MADAKSRWKMASITNERSSVSAHESGARQVAALRRQRTAYNACTMTTPNFIATATWTPKSFKELEGKAHMYATARIKETGECVKLVRYNVQGVFTVDNGRTFWWDELDSYCL